MRGRRVRPSRPIPGLTGVLVDVSRIAGPEAAMALAQAWGGRQLHMPLRQSLRPDHPLVTVLGWRAAVAVASALGGNKHNIPTARLALMHWQVRQLYGAGWSGSAIAAALHVDRSTVRRATAGVAPPAGPPQPVTLSCLCCGRPMRLVPPAPVVAAGEDDAAYAATLPPLLHYAVEVGATTVAALRALDKQAPLRRGSRPG